MLGPSVAVSKRVVFPLKRNDKQTVILLIILSDIHCVFCFVCCFFFILNRTASPLLVRCSHKRIKCNCRRVWQRKFLKAHALHASKAKQRDPRKKSSEGREKRNVEVFDYPRREGIDEDMARDQGFSEVNKTLSSTPYGQTEYGKKKNDENRQCYENSLDVDETSEMEKRSEKNKDGIHRPLLFIKWSTKRKSMKSAKRMSVVANSYKRFRAAWENRATQCRRP